MKISIRNLKDRKTFDFDVEPTHTVDDVKYEIEKQSGVAKGSQRLVFGGKPLRDDQKLSEAGIQKGATLHLVIHLPDVPSIDALAAL